MSRIFAKIEKPAVKVGIVKCPRYQAHMKTELTENGNGHFPIADMPTEQQHGPLRTKPPQRLGLVSELHRFDDIT